VTSTFCDPRSPWQKGAVENANGHLRRYLPSDAPADHLTGDNPQALAERFNATPRRCLGYRTPAEEFNGRLNPNPAKCDTTATVSHLAGKQQFLIVASIECNHCFRLASQARQPP